MSLQTRATSRAISLFFIFQVVQAQPVAWQQLSILDSSDVRSITTTPSGVIFAATAYGVYRSTDWGVTWPRVRYGGGPWFDGSPDILRANSRNDVFLAVGGMGIERTTNHGQTWEPINNGFPWHYLNALAISPSDTMYMSGIGGVYKSTNYGNSWDTLGLRQNNHRALLVTSDRTVYVGTADQERIFRSTDGGTSWVVTDSGINSTVYALCEGLDNQVFAGTYMNVFRTTNSGATWTGVQVAPPTNGGMFGIVRDAMGRLYASFSGAGVYCSTDNGENWQTLNQGLANLYVRDIHIGTDGYLYLGTWNQGVYRSTTPTVGVTQQHDMVPFQFSLEQNYPNPFNGTTVIRYSLLQPTDVVIEIIDILGRNVSTIQESKSTAGEHQILVDANNLPTGVYLYRLTAGGASQTKKFMLLR